jgi:hypothetical protein
VKQEKEADESEGRGKRLPRNRRRRAGKVNADRKLWLLDALLSSKSVRQATCIEFLLGNLLASDNLEEQTGAEMVGKLLLQK